VRIAERDGAPERRKQEIELGLASDEDARKPGRSPRARERERAASTSLRSPNSNAPPTAATVRSPARISPGSAAFCRRSQVLTASPVTNELPSRGTPTTTSPVLAPIRISSSPSNMPSSLRCIARAACSARSA
jgi:hypothetical protein